MDLRIYRASTRYVHVPFTSNADPSTLTVWIAVKPIGTPAVLGDLKVAQWLPGETWSGTRTARLLIGPTSTFGALTPGLYRMYGALDDNPEDPFEPTPNCLRIT